jgi:hypothetical protein
MSRIACATLLALACMSVVALSACGAASPSSAQPAPSLTATTSGGAGPAGGMPVRPHFEKKADGRALASGWLRHIDLEGGFWALIAEPPGATTNAPTVIAVLLPGKVTETRIAKHAGAYLIAQGRVSTDASIRKAGPEIFVNSIRLLARGQ